MRKRTVAGLAAILACSIALGAFEAVTIKATPKEGDTFKYRQTGKFDVNGMEVDTSAVETRKVLKVDAVGNVSIKEEVTDVKFNGQDVPEGSAPPPKTVTSTSKGVLVKVEGDKVDENDYREDNLESVVYPDKPVNAGDSWTADIKGDKTTGAVDAKGTFTYVGEETVNGAGAFKIKFSIKEVGDAGASTDGAFWLSKGDATLLKYVSKWTNVPISGVGPVSGDIILTRVTSQ